MNKIEALKHKEVADARAINIVTPVEPTPIVTYFEEKTGRYKKLINKEIETTKLREEVDELKGHI